MKITYNKNLCGCGIMANIQDRLLECISNSERITELYKKLTQLKVQLQISLSLLLMHKQQEILIILYEILKVV
jgi:hypothetical protein